MQHVFHIQQELSITFAKKFLDDLPQSARAFAELELAEKVDDDDAIHQASADLNAHAFVPCDAVEMRAIGRMPLLPI